MGCGASSTAAEVAPPKSQPPPQTLQQQAGPPLARRESYHRTNESASPAPPAAAEEQRSPGDTATVRASDVAFDVSSSAPSAAAPCASHPLHESDLPPPIPTLSGIASTLSTGTFASGSNFALLGSGGHLNDSHGGVGGERNANINDVDSDASHASSVIDAEMSAAPPVAERSPVKPPLQPGSAHPSTSSGSSSNMSAAGNTTPILNFPNPPGSNVASGASLGGGGNPSAFSEDPFAPSGAGGIPVPKFFSTPGSIPPPSGRSRGDSTASTTSTELIFMRRRSSAAQSNSVSNGSHPNLSPAPGGGGGVQINVNASSPLPSNSSSDSLRRYGHSGSCNNNMLTAAPPGIPVPPGGAGGPAAQGPRFPRIMLETSAYPPSMSSSALMPPPAFDLEGNELLHAGSASRMQSSSRMSSARRCSLQSDGERERERAMLDDGLGQTACFSQLSPLVEHPALS